tara:strand:+ start:499 stop:699 length:201 start_codon:yes stop_codon:yes gene_type:complete
MFDDDPIIPRSKLGDELILNGVALGIIKDVSDCGSRVLLHKDLGNGVTKVLELELTRVSKGNPLMN